MRLFVQILKGMLPVAIVGVFATLGASHANAGTIFTTSGTGQSLSCSDSNNGLGGSSCPNGDAGAFNLSTTTDGVTGFGLDTSNHFITGDNHETSCDASNHTCTETVTITDRVTASGDSIAASTALPISWDFLVGADGNGSVTVVNYDLSLTLSRVSAPVGTGFTADTGTTAYGQTISTGSSNTITGTVTGTTNASHGIEDGTYTATTTLTITYYQSSTNNHEVQIAVEVPDSSIDFGSNGSTGTPEPATFGFCGLGLAALGWIARRRA